MTFVWLLLAIAGVATLGGNGAVATRVSSSHFQQEVRVQSAACHMVPVGLRVPADKAARLFAGFNDILGPVITDTPFGDANLMDLTRRLNIGALRHPGGTVANYWSLVNGTYSSPCTNPELPILGDRCKYADAIARNGLPPRDVFTPQNFVDGVGSSLINTTATSSALPIVFDLNLLTLSDADMVGQLAALDRIVVDNNHQRQPPRSIMIELGNELFYTPFYGSVVPNGTEYMRRVKLMVDAIHARWDDTSSQSAEVSIAIVANPLGGIISDQHWDATISRTLQQDMALRRSISAVTIHDYSCDVDDLTSTGDVNRQRETMALWGARKIPDLHAYVSRIYNADVVASGQRRLGVWMTEFNTGVLGHAALVAANATYSVLHSIFALNYAIAGACDTGGEWDVLMLHMLWQQAGMTSSPLVWLDGWGVAQIPKGGDSGHDDKAAATTWTVMAQIVAHFGNWAFVGGGDDEGGNKHVMCLQQQQQQPDSDSACPNATTSLPTTPCVRGVLLRQGGQSQTYMFTNGCDNQPRVSSTTTALWRPR